jgi:2-keto-4-pentenoate hydratase/2-oxohepta-3-ene-1,7-dioic acid hydratase in catechol pathway
MMRLLTYLSENGPAVASLEGQRWVDLQDADPSLPRELQGIVALGDAGWEQVAAATAGGESLALPPAAILPPILRPAKILCVGLNYSDHARETGQEIPAEPLIFNKLPTTLIGHQQQIVLPRCSEQIDYEAELVVVIGRRGRNIPQSSALEYVAGYCCGNDVSARDWQKQKPGGQWLLGKSFDTFGPVGPHLVTADEVGRVDNLEIECRLNGKTMQRSNTRHLIFPVGRLISYVSQICTLEPGDLLFTGTPPGVGVARNPPVFLQAGDRVEIEVERVGLLCNTVVASE